MRAVEILDVEESPRRFAEHIRIQSETGSVANGDLAVREAAGDQRAAPAQDRVLNDDRLGRLHRDRRHVAIKALERAAVRPARRDDKWAGQSLRCSQYSTAKWAHVTRVRLRMFPPAPRQKLAVPRQQHNENQILRDE